MANVNKTELKTLLVSVHIVSLQPAFKKSKSSSQNKLIFTPNNSNKIEKKFGRNIQALTFALPLKNGVVQREIEVQRVKPKDL